MARRPSIPQPPRVRGPWPMWIRVVVLALVAAGVLWALHWQKATAAWPKVLIVGVALAFMTVWWQGHRRHELAVQTDRRARELRRRSG
jgi:hypothetical protein